MQLNRVVNLVGCRQKSPSTLLSQAFTLLGYLSDLFKKSAAYSNKKLTTSNTMPRHMMR